MSWVFGRPVVYPCGDLVLLPAAFQGGSSGIQWSIDNEGIAEAGRFDYGLSVLNMYDVSMAGC